MKESQRLENIDSEADVQGALLSVANFATCVPFSVATKQDTALSNED